MSKSSIKRRIGRFHIVIVQWTSKKCAKKRDARVVVVVATMITMRLQCVFIYFVPGGTPYNGQYGKAPPERGTSFRHQVYERVGIY